MGLEYQNLDETTRKYMLQEVNLDIENSSLYFGKRLNTSGRTCYPLLLKEAIEKYDDNWLAKEIKHRGYLNTTEEKRSQSGNIHTARVPENAADMLAEGEFNRFYIRGLCRRAIEAKIDNVQVYRGKHVNQPRPNSEALIGRSYSAIDLLNDLRTSIGVDTALGLPGGPNSGLTVRVIEPLD